MYVNDVNVDKLQRYNYSQIFYDGRDSRPKNNNKRYGSEAVIEIKIFIMHILDNKKKRKFFKFFIVVSLVMCKNFVKSQKLLLVV